MSTNSSSGPSPRTNPRAFGIFFVKMANSPKWGRANTPNVLRQTSQPRTRIGGIDLTEKETKYRENSIKDTFCYVFLITAQLTLKTSIRFSKPCSTSRWPTNSSLWLTNSCNEATFDCFAKVAESHAAIKYPGVD